MSSTKYIFTKEHFEKFKAMKAINPGSTIKQFSKKIGRSPQTVSRAIKGSPHKDAVFALCPMMHTKQVQAQDRVTNKKGWLLCNAHPAIARAATMAWRAAA